MADEWIDLAGEASLLEIINFWDTYGLLDGLFKAKGIKITIFKVAGLSFGRLRKVELGVYQLMVEINHVHYGIWYRYVTFHKGSCNKFPESHFSVESMEYGFDKLSS